MSVRELLDEFATADVTEGDVTAMMRTTLLRLRRSAAAPLSATSRDFVMAHGGDTARTALDRWDPAAEERRRFEVAVADSTQTLAQTWTTHQVAEQLGKDASRVRHQVSQDPPTLYSVKVGGRRLVPRWQVVDGALLPGLAALVPVIPADVHPSDIATLMTTERDDLNGRTPVRHLAEGGDVAPVVALVRDLTR